MLMNLDHNLLHSLTQHLVLHRHPLNFISANTALLPTERLILFFWFSAYSPPTDIYSGISFKAGCCKISDGQTPPPFKTSIHSGICCDGNSTAGWSGAACQCCWEQSGRCHGGESVCIELPIQGGRHEGCFDSQDSRTEPAPSFRGWGNWGPKT